MARGRKRKISTETLDKKIELQKEEIMEAAIKSEHSYAEIMLFSKR